MAGYGTFLLAASTAQIEQRVQLFGILKTVFAVVAFLFLLLSIALFITYDIRTVIGEKTGRIAKKSIEELERANEQSGRLRSKSSRKREKRSGAGLSGQIKAMDGQPHRTEAPGTALLKPGNSSETAVLESGNGSTTLLGAGESQAKPESAFPDHQVHYAGPDGAPTAALEEKHGTSAGKFVVTKNIMLIHTDEYI